MRYKAILNIQGFSCLGWGSLCLKGPIPGGGQGNVSGFLIDITYQRVEVTLVAAYFDDGVDAWF